MYYKMLIKFNNVNTFMNIYASSKIKFYEATYD